MTSWKRLSSKKIVSDRWLSLRADTCELPSGRVLESYYVLEEKEYVHIYAQNEQGRILIVQQYRYAADAVCFELPGGVAEDGETLLEAAKRELLEETGYVAESWTNSRAVVCQPSEANQSSSRLSSPGPYAPVGVNARRN